MIDSKDLQEGQAMSADYMETYDQHWKGIVENEDGTLNKDKVARELADALTLQHHLSEIYMEVSSSAVSKPFTLPSVVIAMYHDSLTEAADDAINELVDSIEKGGTGLPTSAADVVSLIRELTGVQPRGGEA